MCIRDSSALHLDGAVGPDGQQAASELRADGAMSVPARGVVVEDTRVLELDDAAPLALPDAAAAIVAAAGAARDDEDLPSLVAGGGGGPRSEY